MAAESTRALLAPLTWAALFCGTWILASPSQGQQADPIERFNCDAFQGVELRVSDREGLGGETIGRALGVAWARGALEAPASYTVASGETACGIVTRMTGWPDGGRGRCADTMLSLLRLMNKKADLDKLQVGDKIQIPMVCIEERFYPAEIRREGERVNKQLQKLGIPGVMLGKLGNSGYDEQTVLIRYIVRIPVHNSELAMRLADDTELKDLRDVSVRAVGFNSKTEFTLYSVPGTATKDVSAQQNQASNGARILPNVFRDQVTSTKTCPTSNEGDLSRLLPSNSDEGIRKPACSEEKCPGAIILDPGLRLEHADFSEQWPDGDTCTFIPTLSKEEQERSHATGLFGIISAKSNGYGLVGISPSTAPQVEQLQDNLEVPTSELIMQRIGKPRRWLYVTATSWQDDLSGGSYSPLSEAVASAANSALWVVAAGQSETSGTTGRRISDNDLESPMNLGNHANVLVVTACDECGPNNGKLRDNVNHSSEFVHIAAPGKDIPTTYKDKSYTSMSGTSPATAIVGAYIRELWTSEAGGKLKSPAEMKARVQVTSRPLIFPPEQRDWLAAGVLDPNVLFLDPEIVWLRKPDSDKHVPIEVDGWCDNGSLALPLVNPKSGLDPSFVELSLIRRIVRADDGTEDKGWFFYLATRVNREHMIAEWLLQNKGPASLPPVQGVPAKWGKKAPLLRKADGSTLSLSDIGDLIGNPAIATKRLKCL